MLKAFGAALLLVSALAMTADPARALQVVVTQVDKNTDGSMTYHFAVKTDPGETLTPGASKATGDFVTVYNFYGLIDGSAKVPAGWEFSSETSGRTPELNGYPLVLPVDVPNTPNLTWTVTKPVAAGVQIDGFTDSVGTESYNQSLSQERADAVKSSLVSRGIDSTRIGSQGYGKGFPVADNTDSGGRQLNRRVEVVIGNDGGGSIAARS